MTRIQLVLIFSFLMSTLHAQQEWQVLESLLEQHHFPRIQRLLKMYSDSEEGSGQSMQVTELFTRHLFDSYDQMMFRLEKYENLRYKKAFYLKLIRSGKQLVYASMQEVDGDRSTLKLWRDAIEWPEFITAHQERYPSDSYAIENYYFIPSQPVMVGFSCGYAGMGELQSDELWHLILTKDHRSIRQWAVSVNPEIRCYGAIGLTILKLHGTKLTEKDLLLLRMAEQDNTKVDMCQGALQRGFQATFSEMYLAGIKHYQRRLINLQKDK